MPIAASGDPRMTGTICVVEAPVSSPIGAGARAEPLGQTRDMGPLFIHAGHEVERGVDGAEHGGRKRRGVDDAATAIDEIVAHRLGRSDITAKTAKRLGEGADDDIGVGGKAGARSSQNSCRMRVVDDEAGVMLAREASDLFERRDVAIHGEHALGQDEAGPLISLILTQKLGEMGGVAMPVAELPHAGGLAAEMHARVIEPVGEDERLGTEHGLVEQRLEHRGVGLEARRHHQRGRLPLERGKLGLDRRKQVEIAGDEPRGAGADAVSFGPFDRAGDQRLVEAKPEIVVAGEIDVGPSFRADDPRIARRDRQQRSPQALASASVEKGPVPAFACRHDPVLAKGSGPSNQSRSMPELQKSANPFNGDEHAAKPAGESAAKAVTRHDWTRDEVIGLLSMPLLELLDQARAVHRRHHEDGTVQLASLLSIKTGACPEDCTYCPQSAHYAKTDRAQARDVARRRRRAGQGAGSPRRPAPRDSAWARPGAR